MADGCVVSVLSTARIDQSHFKERNYFPKLTQRRNAAGHPQRVLDAPGLFSPRHDVPEFVYVLGYRVYIGSYFSFLPHGHLHAWTLGWSMQNMTITRRHLIPDRAYA
jgi:hypothetical protein